MSPGQHTSPILRRRLTSNVWVIDGCPPASQHVEVEPTTQTLTNTIGSFSQMLTFVVAGIFFNLFKFNVKGVSFEYWKNLKFRKKQCERRKLK